MLGIARTFGAVTLLALAAACLTPQPTLAAGAAYPGEPELPLGIEPERAIVGAGEPFGISIVERSGPTLAITTDLTFDPSLLQIVDVSAGAYYAGLPVSAGNSGQTVQEAIAEANSTGTLHQLHVERSPGSAAPPAAPTERALEVSMRANRPAVGVSRLRLSNSFLRLPAGNYTGVDANDGRVDVGDIFARLGVSADDGPKPQGSTFTARVDHIANLALSGVQTDFVFNPDRLQIAGFRRGSAWENAALIAGVADETHPPTIEQAITTANETGVLENVALYFIPGDGLVTAGTSTMFEVDLRAKQPGATTLSLASPEMLEDDYLELFGILALSTEVTIESAPSPTPTGSPTSTATPGSVQTGTPTVTSTAASSVTPTPSGAATSTPTASSSSVASPSAVSTATSSSASPTRVSTVLAATSNPSAAIKAPNTGDGPVSRTRVYLMLALIAAANLVTGSLWVANGAMRRRRLGPK